MLTNTTNVNRYQIVGTPLSTYSISYPYWNKTEIVVYLTNSDGSLTTLTEGTNYTLSTPNGNNGTLTRVGDWTAGATNLTIVREMSFTQEVDLRNGDKMDAETLETALDDLTAQVQQLAESQSRAVISSIDEAGSSLTIPNKASRIGSGSGTMMGFGSDGESIALRDLAQFDADVASAASDASSASTSAGTATTQALKSEGFAVGEQNGASVGNTSPYYQNNSKYYSQVAKAGADVITNNLSAINNLDANMSDINDVADDITNVVAVAGDLINIDSVAGDLTNIDAVNSNKTNIDTVAGISSDVTTVAGISADVTTVAGATTDIATILPDIADVTAVAGDLAKVTAVADDLTNIDTVEADLTNVDTVAGSISNVNAVGGNITNVNAVAGNATNINAVNANKTNIDTVAGKASDITTVAGKANDVSTVAGIASNVTTVAGKATEITTVAGIASDVSAVAAVDDDISAVADELTDIGTVVTNLTDISAVASDMTKVTAVADDLTNIDAVADDLTNIDTVVTNLSDITTVSGDITKISAVADDLTNIDAVADDLTNIDAASSYALEAEGWANGTQGGTPVSSGSPYYENNAKFWADAVPAINDTLSQHEARIENLEEKEGGYNYTIPPAKSPWSIPTGKAENMLLESAEGVGRIENELYDLVLQWVGTTNGVTFTKDTTNHTITLNNTANAVIYASTPSSFKFKKDHFYLFIMKGWSSSNVFLSDQSGLGVLGAGTSIYETTIKQAVATGGDIRITIPSGRTFTNHVLSLFCRDITQYFDTNDLSFLGVNDSAKLAKIQSDYPWLLAPSDFDSGTPRGSRYEGWKSFSINIWDETLTANKWLNFTTGAVTDFSGRCVSTNYQRCEGSTTYYIKGNCAIAFYDANGTYIPTGSGNYADGSTVTTEANAYKFLVGIPYATYGNDVQICLNSYTDKTIYHPHVLDTLTLSSAIELKSAGTVSEKAYLNVNREAWKTNPLGSVDLGQLEWEAYDADIGVFRSVISGAINHGDSSNTANLFSVFVPGPVNSISSGNMQGIGLSGNSQTIYLCDNSFIGKTANQVETLLDGVMLYYELATPSAPTQITPTLNNKIKTEANGHISSVLTNPIDDKFTVGYLAI